MLWSCRIILQETAGIIIIIFIFFARMKITHSLQESKYSELKTHRRATQGDKLKGGRNKWIWCWLLSGDCCDSQAAALTSGDPHHWALFIFSMASPPNTLRSSSIFPLRGYESKYDGTHNIKNEAAAHFFSAFCGNLEGHCVWFTPELIYFQLRANNDVNIVWKTNPIT